MANTSRTVFFLHGLGEGPEVWQPIIDRLPEGFTGVAPTLAGMRDADDIAFSMEEATHSILREADSRLLDNFDLCGLSLGAVVATQLAIAHGERIGKLAISGGQVRPNPLLMRGQSLAMRAIPESRMPEGMSKRRLLDVLNVMSRVDLRSGIKNIDVPTLVMCGLRDRPNLPAARCLARSIAGARLELVGGAGHLWHAHMPQAFSGLLNAFLSRPT
ncbi:MAG: alpha/beta fold hydrolase [Actinomycetaceae bacterium]|nr:alpha/beta fold hydrolase [Actinomycetaceae bacterium]